MHGLALAHPARQEMRKQKMDCIRCEIKTKLPSLNEYINACRLNRYAAADFKRVAEAHVCLYIARLPQFTKPIRIHFIWIENNHRRDYDNIAAGGRKFILDAMVKAGKLKDDNRRYVVGFSDDFVYAKEAGVILEIWEDKE